ncbi:vanadium-dependent haloperoxidase [Kribbella sp. NPDC051586]|uniref:vanadium-dependent haloperoxidase n=1 Tax=Kribbella sp. NPDC051586 TaxID=3364118 RepID=UPI0037B2F777
MTSPVSRRGLLIAGGTTAAAVAVGATNTTFAAAQTAARVPSLEVTRQARTGADVVIAWNQALLEIVRTPGLQPPTVHPTRSFALLHAAIHNAVVATTGKGTPYLFAVHAASAASPIAAAAQAGHDILVALYPAEAVDLGHRLTDELRALGHAPGREAGIAAGRLTARLLLDLRADDGSAVVPPPLAPGTRPGQYRPTPPAGSPAVFTHWSAVRPFLIKRADRFRPEAYPDLGGRRYAAAINEVQRLGQDTSGGRSEDQTEQGNFWAAPIWNYWNEITQTAISAEGNDLVRAARVFAHLNLALADAVIAFYDAKYHFRIWRPVTAIRLADQDGNPATRANPSWNPLATTPADPSYPGAHSVVSQTAATLLSQEFDPRLRLAVTSDVLPGVTRKFRSLQAIADEAGLSRLYAGIHTKLDHYAGQELGHNLARSLLTHPELRP